MAQTLRSIRRQGKARRYLSLLLDFGVHLNSALKQTAKAFPGMEIYHSPFYTGICMTIALSSKANVDENVARQVRQAAVEADYEFIRAHLVATIIEPDVALKESVEALFEKVYQGMRKGIHPTVTLSKSQRMLPKDVFDALSTAATGPKGIDIYAALNSMKIRLEQRIEATERMLQNIRKNLP